MDDGRSSRSTGAADAAVAQTKERSTFRRKRYPAGPRPRPHDAARRRGLSLGPAASWSDVATLCAHARHPGRSWATNVSRPRSVHPPASSQMVTGRTKRPASYRAGHARGRRTAARREDVVGCATRVAWAAASPFRGVRRGWVGRASTKVGIVRPSKAALDLRVVLVAAKATGSPQNWPGRTSATHLRAAPLNFPAAYRRRAQEGGPVDVCPERESGAL